MTNKQVCLVIIIALFGWAIIVTFIKSCVIENTTSTKITVPIPQTQKEMYKVLNIGNERAQLDVSVYNLTVLLVKTGYDPYAHSASKSGSYKPYRNGGIITVQYRHSVYTHKDGCIQQGYSYTIEASVDLNGNIIKIISQVK